MAKTVSRKKILAESKPGFLKNYQHPDLYGEWLGYHIRKLNRKTHEAEVTITLRDDHLSPAGRVHGGVVSGFFDFACGAAVFTTLGPRDYCSTVELKVNYFRPLFSGDKLVSRARVVFLGKRLCVIHASLFRGREKDAVAMATATFNIKRSEAGDAGPSSGSRINVRAQPPRGRRSARG